MAHKMKGFPMQDTSSTHGTNANYKKSGPPFLGLGLLGGARGLFGKGKGKPCPPAAAPAPVAAGAAAAGTPGVEGPGPATPPVVDPNAGVSDQGEAPVPMKRNLKVGAPKMDSPKTGKDVSWKSGY